jgi:hypothetical protein
MGRAQERLFTQMQHLAGNVACLPDAANPSRRGARLGAVVRAQMAVSQMPACFNCFFLQFVACNPQI